METIVSDGEMKDGAGALGSHRPGFSPGSTPSEIVTLVTGQLL